MINCPGTCSAEYLGGSVVKLTATPDVHSIFTGWTGVPLGHELDNPVTVTVNGNVTVDATFAAIAAALVATSPTIALSAGTYYLSLTTAMVKQTSEILGNNSVKLSVPISLRSLWIRLGAALTSGQTVTAKFYVTGAASNVIVANLVSGDQIGHGNGTLALNAGDRLCVQVVFAGSGTFVVNSLSAGYAL